MKFHDLWPGIVMGSLNCAEKIFILADLSMCCGSIPSTSLSFLTRVQNWTEAGLLVPGTWGLARSVS